MMTAMTSLIIPEQPSRILYLVNMIVTKLLITVMQMIRKVIK